MGRLECQRLLCRRRWCRTALLRHESGGGRELETERCRVPRGAECCWCGRVAAGRAFSGRHERKTACRRLRLRTLLAGGIPIAHVSSDFSIGAWYTRSCSSSSPASVARWCAPNNRRLSPPSSVACHFDGPGGILATHRLALRELRTTPAFLLSSSPYLAGSIVLPSGLLPASRSRRGRGCRHQRAHGQGVRCLTNTRP